MLLIPNILTPFNSKESAVSEPLKLRSWRFTSKCTLLYYCLTTLLKHHLCPDGAMAPLPPPWIPLILAIIIIQPLRYTNPVESQDHPPTALFDTRHLNNGTIFLHLCVFVVPLSGLKRLLHHLALILNPLLILCRGVFHSRPNTHLFSKRFPLQPSLIHGLLSRILTCWCMEVSDVVDVGISTYPVLTYLLTYPLEYAVATS